MTTCWFHQAENGSRKRVLTGQKKKAAREGRLSQFIQIKPIRRLRLRP
jgi:hypothetical protein